MDTYHGRLILELILGFNYFICTMPEIKIEIHRTNSRDSNFIELVKELDKYLAVVDGEDHAFYNKYNSIDLIRHVLVAYSESAPVGCGAIKQYNSTTMEVKRMYVTMPMRGTGAAKVILDELERWAIEMDYERLILETGRRQADAVAFYMKCGFTEILNYGQYEGMENSLCFEKQIKESDDW